MALWPLTVLIGASILAVFMAMFNSLTPSGTFVIISRVVEVTPNVSGQITAVPVQTNVPVKAGTVLFQIDPAPYQFKVDQLEASLAHGKQQVQQLKASFEQASASVDGLIKQLAFQEKRLGDIRRLASTKSVAEFREQDTQAQYDTMQYQLLAAKAAQDNSRIAVESEIGGVNTNVAQIQAQLEQAKWELDQTTIVAPDDGYVSSMAVAVGARALPARPVLSFIVAADVTIVGMFQPNGFPVIRQGAKVRLVFGDLPGRRFNATITDVPRGVGQGQIAVSGVLARSGSIGGANAYPALISIPKEIPREQLRLGMPGTATVFAENAGAMGILMSILVWISSYTAYL